MADLQKVFGGGCEDQILCQLLKEVGTNNDNQVKFNLIKYIDNI